MRIRHKSTRLQEEKINDQVCEGKQGRARACSTLQRRVRQRIKDYWQENIACFSAAARSPESVRNLSRTKKSIEKDSQKLEARLAAKIIGDGLELFVCETEEEIDKLEQKMEELLTSDSQSLRPRVGHPNAYNKEREHQQTSWRWHNFNQGQA